MARKWIVTLDVATHDKQDVGQPEAQALFVELITILKQKGYRVAEPSLEEVLED